MCQNLQCQNFIKRIESVESINPLLKISIFGCNVCSVDIVVNFILQQIAAKLCVYDESQTKLDLLVSDFKYFKLAANNLDFTYSNDIKKTAKSDICILCFEEEPFSPAKKYESCLKNIQLYEKHTPNIVKYSPNAILIVATYPYSLMTHFCWKFSMLPSNRVFGLGLTSGTELFRHVLSNYLNISANDVYGWVSGVNTLDNSKYSTVQYFPLWSTVSVAGIRIENLIDKDEYKTFKREMNNMVLNIESGINQFIQKYGRPIHDINSIVHQICESILTNSRMVFSVSYNVKGLYNIDYDVFIGLPCTIGGNGVICNVNLKLERNEVQFIRNSSKSVAKDIELLQKLLTEELENKTDYD